MGGEVKPVAFVGYECSGALRSRLAALGFDAYSADLKPAEDDGLGTHLVMDVFRAYEWLKRNRLDPVVAVFHPDCTYLTNSAAWAFNEPDFHRYPGVGYHQKLKPGTLTGNDRRLARLAALIEVQRLWRRESPGKGRENPRGALSTLWRKPTQSVQPYMFGDDASKETCLWIDGADPLPLPQRSQWVKPRLVPRAKALGKSDLAKASTGPEFMPRWANQTDTGQNRLSPGEQRATDRARTYPGIADALARHLAQTAGL